MASFIHYLTNTNHTSIKSQPLYFGWGLHLYIKCAKTVCLEGSYNQVKIKKKTLYPTVQRLRDTGEGTVLLFVLVRHGLILLALKTEKKILAYSRGRFSHLY